MALFKAYDIRGIVPDDLNAEKAYSIGRAIAAFMESGPIAVGRDARSHSPELTAALIDGIRDEGLDVLDLGLVATPMLYFGVEQLSANAGVMVTASHNPGEYNGFFEDNYNRVDLAGLQMKIVQGRPPPQQHHHHHHDHHDHHQRPKQPGPRRQQQGRQRRQRRGRRWLAPCPKKPQQS